MSIWTHVAGTIRIDHLRSFDINPTPDFDNIFKKFIYTDTLDISELRKGAEECNMPTGSEGSLDYRVIENPNENDICAYTVVIFGDLRDFGKDNINEIKDWWKNMLSKFAMIRQAVLQIQPEDGETLILIIKIQMEMKDLLVLQVDYYKIEL